MKSKIKFYPLSIPFIICIILINIILLGLIVLFVMGILKNNWIYTSVGFLGFVFLLIEDISLLSWHIILCDQYLVVHKSIFGMFLGNKKNQKIYYKDIEVIELILMPTQIICIKCFNNDNINKIYVKQFSKKQINILIKELEAKTRIENAKGDTHI